MLKFSLQKKCKDLMFFVVDTVLLIKHEIAFYPSQGLRAAISLKTTCISHPFFGLKYENTRYNI